MQVDIRTRDVDLGIQQATQADRDGRVVALEEARVADDRKVRAESMPVGLEPGVEVGRPGLLLALEHVADVDGQTSLGLQPGTHGPQVEMDLALVVRRATGEDPAVLDARLEWRPDPQVERIHRLHVVVAIHEDGRCAVGVQPVGVHHRMSAGRGHLDVLQAPSLQPLRHELGRSHHVRVVLRERPDARDAQEVDVVGQALVRRAVQEGVDAGDGVGHGSSGHVTRPPRCTHGGLSG